jgi:hypothetical protein
MPGVPLPIQESMSADPYSQLEVLLDQLDEEERLLSAERRRLQDRIDYFASTEQSPELAELERKEQDLSRRRRELHERIDTLRGI